MYAGTRMSHPALSNQHFFSHVQVNARLRIRDKGRPSSDRIIIHLLFITRGHGSYPAEIKIRRNKNLSPDDFISFPTYIYFFFLLSTKFVLYFPFISCYIQV